MTYIISVAAVRYIVDTATESNIIHNRDIPQDISQQRNIGVRNYSPQRNILLQLTLYITQLDYVALYLQLSAITDERQ
jgi:hypothetical protein